ncbi:MFS transporter [Microbacterium mangrovi]|uniref:MFS transporter n=1 Tax=Microbacterium mangrovi TaxID=1348253 RepID=A0A0B2A6J1_9MICO|nr:MFS transporter [Microbacterium mangrovi]KHK99154.1 MFS transporter [Microbacterium mangrovi]
MSTETRVAPPVREHTPAKAWLMLVLGVLAQAAGTFLVSTPAYLIVLLHASPDHGGQGMSLAQAGLLASAPTFGMVCTLVAWGALVDRRGERGVIAGGLLLTALFALAASAAQGFVALAILLMLGGAASASTNSASGRIVVGWFPRSRRGLAMGIRQMSQPLGVAAAALVVPPLAAGAGLTAPLLVAAAATGVLAVACWFGIRNPPRPAVAAASSGARPANPYARDRFLVRIHAVSVLLVVPQFTLSIFGLVWMTTALGWNAAVAGGLIAVSQFIGALGRIAVGSLSDRVGSRVRVLRQVALAGVVVMGLLAACGAAHWDVAAGAVFLLATAVSVADNGLAFTSVAEAAGPAWSGRALGIQNTGQFVAASVVGPGVGALVTAVGFPLAFAAVALTPLVALGLVPREDRHAS